MKTMILNDYGPAAAFTPTEPERPSVKPGHVLVRVKATSVNTVDTMIRDMGKDLPLSPDLPAILGMDFAGIVEEVGEGVAGFAVGDEVYGCAGGLADPHIDDDFLQTRDLHRIGIAEGVAHRRAYFAFVMQLQPRNVILRLCHACTASCQRSIISPERFA